MQDINSKIHHVTSSAMQIKRVLVATLTIPFSKRITDIKIRQIDKLCIPSYFGDAYPTDHVTAFKIAIGRTHFTR